MMGGGNPLKKISKEVSRVAESAVGAVTDPGTLLTGGLAGGGMGMIAIGDVKNCGVFLRLIKEGIDISSIKNELISETFSYARVLDLLRKKDEVFIV